MTAAPRRAPAPQDRKLDADRTRRRLLDAALEEFSAKGLAGARVQDIADRAGVNKQLISYHFGGKQGLYEAIMARWLAAEEEFNDPDVPLHDLIIRYLDNSMNDPRGTRLGAWRALTEEPPAPADAPHEDLSELERRQAAGELADDLDPAAVMLVMMAMVSAPTLMPDAVVEVFGLDPRSAEFRERYAGQLRRIVRHLAGGSGQSR
ncbi:TetR family transcriptional regulator [Actinomadura hibisca]|uniref:TetR family transcriptional regulator n=1 Tax=Actinomadura hibisca TaxID=68565 RepID=UPI000835074A|nr:TetR family transcriptional regulator [Actinomadura hibisca]